MPKIPKGATYSIDRVSQRIDLKEVTGLDFSQSPDLKLKAGQLIIDRIAERTKKGQDIAGDSFASYSPNYKDSLTFKAFGKSSKVNMELSGSMLSAIDVEDGGGNFIDIFVNDDLETKKSYNHNVGDTLPKRQFFGVYTSDPVFEKIKEEIGSEIEEENIDEESLTALSLFSSSRQQFIIGSDDGEGDD